MYSPWPAERRQVLADMGAALGMAALVGYWWLFWAVVVVIAAATLRRWWQFEAQAHRKETALLEEAEHRLQRFRPPTPV
jgi:hypothetical protein